MTIRNLLLTVTLVTSLAAGAKVSLPYIISDGMIVQRDEPVVLWGTADPGETVTINAKRNGKSKSYAKAAVTATADAEGRWRAELPAMQPGAPYTVQINDVTLDNVTPGDVFICSGQSNMELLVNRVTDMFADEIASYNNNDVREFCVPNNTEFHTPLDDVLPTSWKPATQDNVMNFSALAYFFGKALYEKTGVPVGLIRTCWGGTPVESWISEQSIAPYPQALNQKRMYEDDAYREMVKHTERENYRHWNETMNANDPGLNGTTKWYAPAYDDSDWRTVDLMSTDWGSDGLNTIHGTHWFRKDIDVPASMVGKPGMLRMGCIVDADSIYVNGVFVGNVTYQYPPRKYQIPAGLLHEGKNNVTIRLISQYGMPRFVPEKPYKVIVDSAEISLEGDWRYHLGAPMPNAPGVVYFQHTPTVLYNAMIHPLLNYPVAGAVWYQGESNVSRHNQYADLLEIMMADWRAAFDDPDMPFYIVELADYLHPNDVGGRAAWAELRKQQAKAADDTPNAYLIPNSDLGEWNDIHPLDKKTVGQRVANQVYENMNANKGQAKR